jgi:hypothetical protein
MFGQVVQVLGSLLILIPFGLTQLGRVESKSRSYQLLNLAGSATLAADATVTGQWGFLLLEGAWAVMSLAGLMRSVLAAIHGRPHDRHTRGRFIRDARTVHTHAARHRYQA